MVSQKKERKEESKKGREKKRRGKGKGKKGKEKKKIDCSWEPWVAFSLPYIHAPSHTSKCKDSPLSLPPNMHRYAYYTYARIKEIKLKRIKLNLHAKETQILFTE